MPYAVEKRGDKWVTINKDTGAVKGTHDSKVKAIRQMRLLYMVKKDQDLTNNNKGVIVKEITRTQADFLDFCEKYGWGKIEVTVVKGEPVASKELEKTHRHDA